MRIKLVASIVMFFLVVGFLLGVVESGAPTFATRSKGGEIAAAQPTLAVGTNPIARENSLQGANGWTIIPELAATTQIQAYADATSVAPGKSIVFYVSTQQAGAKYRIDIYRMGWYAGVGARLMASAADLTGVAQGYYYDAQHQLIGCTSCLTDEQTGLVEARWKPSYTLNVPQDWTTGVYLAKFTEAGSGEQTYTPFDVLGNTHSAYVLVTSDTTYAAYNEWGGSSLYEADSGGGVKETGNKKGVKVSFDRPYIDGDGSSGVLLYEIQAIRWFESRGYDVSYMSSVDLHEKPGLLLNHKAYISLGHDEYWTKEMRDGVEAARNQGVGLAFMGANAGFWQMRFEPDSTDVPDRTIDCYKVLTSDNNLAKDPLYGSDNAKVTSQWGDPVVGRPESALVGIMFSDLTHKRFGFPWRVDPQANSPLLKGTGLMAGHQYGCGVVGYEWDRVLPGDSSTPKGLHILATSNTVNDTGQADKSNTSYYIAPSGAMVFATGSIYWAAALDSWRFEVDKTCNGQALVVPGMQALMANVMNALIVKHTQSE